MVRWSVTGRPVSNWKSRSRGVSCSSGTDALLLALMALGYQCGDEVITSPFTFFATAGSLWRLGLKPVFCDIDPRTFNLDPQKIESAITSQTKAIMPVHLFGQSADLDAIRDIAERHDLDVIEDAAQAIGATFENQHVGHATKAAALSFYPTKNLGGAGDGGMVLTDDAELAAKMRLLRNHGARDRYYHDEVGANFRMDSVNAAYLSVKLSKLESYHAARRENASIYDDRLSKVDGVTTPWIDPRCRSVYNQYVIRSERRDALQKYLADHGIGTAIYYPLSLHEQPCFKPLGHHRGDFPESESAADEVLALPIFPELTSQQVHRVADAIEAFFRM